jgi:hypothetical protein
MSKEHGVSGTESVSVFRRGEVNAYYFGSLRNSKSKSQESERVGVLFPSHEEILYRVRQANFLFYMNIKRKVSLPQSVFNSHLEFRITDQSP